MVSENNLYADGGGTWLPGVLRMWALPLLPPISRWSTSCVSSMSRLGGMMTPSPCFSSSLAFFPCRREKDTGHQAPPPGPSGHGGDGCPLLDTFRKGELLSECRGLLPWRSPFRWASEAVLSLLCLTMAVARRLRRLSSAQAASTAASAAAATPPSQHTSCHTRTTLSQFVNCL